MYQIYMPFVFQIAITTLKFGRVEILHQSEGLNSVVKLQVTNVSTEECPYIPWDEFQVFYCIITCMQYLFLFLLNLLIFFSLIPLHVSINQVKTIYYSFKSSK